VATLRRLTAGDLAQIHRLEAETYLPSLHESDEAFLRLIDLFPDVAVGTRHRGRGLARHLVEAMLDLARTRGMRTSELVSVQGSAPFWERFGFRRVEEFEYAPGAPATRMTLSLAGLLPDRQ
jgi:predicted N-acetyltransferase YhbS